MDKSPKYNVYMCQYFCQTFTVDVAEGVTPFMIKCCAKSTKGRRINRDFLDENGECIGIAQSRMYPRAPLPAWAKVTHEWYKPMPDTWADLEPGQLQHVEQGGLLLRPRTDAEPIYYA